MSYSAVQLTLDQDTALGRAGDLLSIPNDRVILPAVLATGAWIPEQLDFLAEHLDPSRSYVLLDVGANVGLFSRQVLNRFPSIHAAHCVEPDEANCRALRQNLAGLRGGTVSIHQVALGMEDGTATFFRDDENCGNRSLHADAMRGRPFTETSTPVAAAGPWLTRTLSGEGAIIWKSDTQGSDEAIIAATPWPIWSRVQVAVAELWRIRKSDAGIAAFLERVADMPHRRLGTAEVSVDDVARYIASDDWTFEDLYLWR